MSSKKSSQWVVAALGHGVVTAFALVVVACSGGDGNNTDGGPSVVAFDGGPHDGGPDASSGDAANPNPISCSPGDVSEFTPVWKKPIVHAQACSSKQITDFYADCLDPNASQESCGRFGDNGTTEDQVCAACLITSPTAAQYGAVIAKQELVELNVGGCLAIEQGAVVDGAGCGGPFEADTQCGDAACASNCPIGQDDASFKAYQNCVTAADLGGCNRYAKKVKDCLDGLDEASTRGSICVDFGNFHDGFMALGPLFCMSDTGSDAGGDAAAQEAGGGDAGHPADGSVDASPAGDGATDAGDGGG
jgi:hypothetical protein